jgi:hypothetical protein
MLKVLFYYLFLIIFVFLFFEGLAYFAGLTLQKKSLIYQSPVLVSNRLVKSYEEYLSKRDELLGWPYPLQFGGQFFDETGARRLPAFEKHPDAPSCITLYGDSYTMSSDVDHASAWGNILSELLGCRIANFGVGGYGVDQAYLRFKRHKKDQSKIVILGHSSVDIIRNVTRSLDLLSGRVKYALKPRFILNTQGKLERLKIPVLSEREYLQFLGLESPQWVLEHEQFYPGGPTGLTHFQFPYTYSLFQNRHNFHLRAKLAGRPNYGEFYTPNHPSGSLEIATLLIKAFHDEVLRRQQVPVIVFFANENDVIFYRKRQQWSYQNLMDALEAHGIAYLNFGPYLIDYMGDRAVNEIFIRGHYNEEANREVAKFMYEHLKNRLTGE